MAAGCAPHHVTEVTSLIREGFESMTEITDVELNRARGQILGSSTLSLESTDSRMNRLARSEFAGEYRDLDEVERMLNLVTPDSVAELARTLLARPMSISAVGDITPDAFAPLRP
jgi:predicted Zn-dependent peptidase